MSTSYGAAETPLHVQARRVRKDRGWTQEEAAERAGMGVRAYQMFENGQSRPQPANRAGIVAALDLDGTVEEGDVVGQWDPDIAAFLNMIGVYMEGLSDKERSRFITAETRRIFQQMRSPARAAEVERDEAEQAMRDALARRSDTGLDQTDESQRTRAKG